MNIGQIVSELKKERGDLNRAITALELVGGQWSQKAKISEKASFTQTSRKPDKGLSSAGRRRISEAMKKRWAERRARSRLSASLQRRLRLTQRKLGFILYGDSR